jgi:hypothetical protein
MKRPARASPDDRRRRQQQFVVFCMVLFCICFVRLISLFLFRFALCALNARTPPSGHRPNARTEMRNQRSAIADLEPPPPGVVPLGVR